MYSLIEFFGMCVGVLCFYLIYLLLEGIRKAEEERYRYSCYRENEDPHM